MEQKNKTGKGIRDCSVLMVLTLLITCVTGLTMGAIFDTQRRTKLAGSPAGLDFYYQIMTIPTPTVTPRPTPTPSGDVPLPPDQVDPSEGRQQAYDPQEPGIRFDFPPGAVRQAIEVRAYRTDLPAHVPPPANGSVGAAFYFGAWIRGQGRTVEEFDRSIVINVGYADSALVQKLWRQWPDHATVGANLSFLSASTSLPLALVVHPALSVLLPSESPPDSYHYYFASGQEDRLRLAMYDPATQSWVKLCSRVDRHANKVSAALLMPTPVEEGGNALFAVILDDTPVLEQKIDEQGNTRLFIPGSNISLGVLAGTVEVGTHFEVTLLPEAPDSDLYRLFPTPVDIKACQADYSSVSRIRHITQFPKPMTVTFDVDANTLSRAGGRANLTIVGLQGCQWVDLEEFGYSVIRGDTGVAVDTGELGAFAMAAR